MIRPFDYRGITRDARGIAHYQGLDHPVIEMLRKTVKQTAEIGRSFQELRESAVLSILSSTALALLSAGRARRRRRLAGQF